jgi:Arc/MetJ-type ribon-helix-helix transcriptional regulator
MGKRLQLQLPTSAAARLDSLVQRTEATSSAEVIRNALRLYEWAVGELEKGKNIALQDADGSFRVVQAFVAGGTPRFGRDA